MQRSFLCPHCEKKYPVLPTLVGRKVRCTSCKSVFQLQYDGIAIKVHVKAKPEEAGTSALEAKEPAADGAASRVALNKGVQSGAAKAPPQRPQTRAIKRKTERIKKIRSTLQSAADSALGSITDTSREVALHQTRPGAKAGGGQGAGAAAPSSVVLTHAGERESRLLFKYMGAAVVLLALSSLLLLIETSPQQRALNEFCGPLTETQRLYPNRMPTYRGRMWLFTRDGEHQPPVILNADDAVLSEPVLIDWTSVVSACAPALNGLEKSSKFALWHELGRSADIDALWEKHPANRNIEEFYLSLKNSGIGFLRYEELQERLFEKGLPKAAVYVASLLLAGTRDADGRPCRDMGLQNGLMPEVLIVSEFAQTDGHILIDAEGGYRYSNSRSFCGLVAGFTGFPGKGDEWRILDFRLDKEMEPFYTRKHNPLAVAAACAYKALNEELFERRAREAKNRP